MNESKPGIRDLFEAALNLPADERAAFLLAHCDDPEQRESIRRLLAADTESAGALPVRTFDDLLDKLPEAEVDSVEPAQGSRIGPFTLLAKLGEGGTSIVYRAEREQAGVQQTVALKLLRHGLYTQDEKRNFRRERLALTQLKHPGIARLIEGDVTDTGIPYIALELVDGVPITDYAREHRLDLRQRLALFVACCRAVEAAHRALIVHRDLKPSNVLVTREGDVKLLDFGIAKLLAADDGQDGTQLQALTPAYAAPEQFDHGPITTATDVYALGVLLCEVVTGVRRERRDTHTPSSRVSANAAPGVLPGSAKHTRKQLRGDLDNIVLKATELDPEQRYSSAGAFADEIERYLAGQPVTAHPPSMWYRTSKFVARHRVGVAATVAFALALGAALAIALSQARAAQQQADRAEAVKGFLVRVFQHASPDENRGVSITPHQLLEKGEAQVDSNLRNQPALRADVSALLGQLYIELGDFDRAGALLGRVMNAPEFASLPDDVRARVLTANAWIESETGANDASLTHARQALALMRGGSRETLQSIAHARSIIGTVLAADGEATEAERTLREFLDQDRVALGDDNQFVADEWLQLGRVLGDAGRYEESEAAFSHAIDGMRAAYGENSNRMAHALNEFSNMLDDKGDLATSERVLRQALAIRLQTLGDSHHDTLTVATNLLSVLELQGRYAEALPQRIQLLDKALAANALHAADIASIHTAIGKDYREIGKLDAAQVELRLALEVTDTMEDPKSMHKAVALRHLALTQVLAGRFDDAEKNFRQVFELRSGREAPLSLTAGLARADLGNIFRLEHRVDEALEQLHAAAAIYTPAVAATNPWQPAVLAMLAEAELDAGHTEAAATAAESAVRFGRSAFVPPNSQLAQPLFALARTDLALGHADRAEPLLREALSLRSAANAPDDVRVLEVKVALAQALSALGRNQESATLRDEIAPLLKASASPYSADLRKRLGDAAMSAAF